LTTCPRALNLASSDFCEARMKRLRTLAIAAAVMLTALLGPAHADEPPTRGEQMLKYRKAVYQAIAWNFGSMAATVQGKQPFDPQDFSLRAERVAFLVPLLRETYGPETRGIAGSKLKSSMWNQRADFDHRLDVAIQRARELASTAKSGDADRSKSAFVATADACKACHEQYRDD
jgi:cytochrome c556